MNENYSIGIVILNYNSYKDTINCVNQYLEQKKITPLIVIVDNNSTNDSYTKLYNEFMSLDNIKIIQSGFNGGYAFGNNIAIKYLFNHTNIENVIISNNDIIISDLFLISKWINAHNRYDTIGLSAPSMCINGTLSPYIAWKFPTFLSDIISCFKTLEVLLGDKKKYCFDNIKNEYFVDCLPGSLFMAKIKSLHRVGYLDEGTFLYMEEVILSTKLKYQGLNNLLLTDITYEHENSKTISTTFKNTTIRRILFNSSILFASKYRNDNPIKLSILSLCYFLGELENTIISFIRKLS